MLYIVNINNKIMTINQQQEKGSTINAYISTQAFHTQPPIIWLHTDTYTLTPTDPDRFFFIILFYGFFILVTGRFLRNILILIFFYGFCLFVCLFACLCIVCLLLLFFSCFIEVCHFHPFKGRTFGGVYVHCICFSCWHAR